MIYFRVDERNRIIDVVDTSDPHVMIANLLGLVETDMPESPNIRLFSEDLIPLYKWDNENVVARDPEEIEADRNESSSEPETASADDILNALLGVTV